MRLIFEKVHTIVYILFIRLTYQQWNVYFIHKVMNFGMFQNIGLPASVGGSGNVIRIKKKKTML